jgi:uncharacterized protein (UPF0276 family)
MNTARPPGTGPLSADASTDLVGIGWRFPHYQQVLRDTPPLGFLEVHSENFFAHGGAALAVLQQARAHYPVSLHGVGLSLGSASGLDDWHLTQLSALVNRIDPVRVSDHASFARGNLHGAAVHASDLLPIPFDDEALGVLCSNVHQVQDRLQRRFMVENLSAYLHWAPGGSPQRTETDFLNNLAARTGCLLLVDVNNIYVNALNARVSAPGTDPMQSCRNWLDAINPEAVGELHLAGHCHVSDVHGDIVIDDHGSRVCPEVWQLYAHAVRRFGPVPTLIEWDTDVPALSVLLDEAAQARGLLTQHCGVAA